METADCDSWIRADYGWSLTTSRYVDPEDPAGLPAGSATSPFRAQEMDQPLWTSLYGPASADRRHRLVVSSVEGLKGCPDLYKKRHRQAPPLSVGESAPSSAQRTMGGGRLQAVQAFIEGADETGRGSGHSARCPRSSRAAVLPPRVGRRPRVPWVRCSSAAGRREAEVSGDGADVAGEREGSLLQVAGGERVLAGPREHGFDEALIRCAVQRELRPEQSVGVVQGRVRAGGGAAGPAAGASPRGRPAVTVVCPYDHRPARPVPGSAGRESGRSHGSPGPAGQGKECCRPGTGGGRRPEPGRRSWCVYEGVSLFGRWGWGCRPSSATSLRGSVRGPWSRGPCRSGRGRRRG